MVKRFTLLAILRNTVKNTTNKRRFMFRIYSIFSIAVNISSESLLKVIFFILFWVGLTLRLPMSYIYIYI